MVGRGKAANDLAGPAVHQNQGRLHGIQVEFDAVVIRVGQNAAQADDQSVAVRMQGKLMGPDAGQFKGLHPFVALLGVVDGDNAFSGLVAAGRGVEPSAIG